MSVRNEKHAAVEAFIRDTLRRSPVSMRSQLERQLGALFALLMAQVQAEWWTGRRGMNARALLKEVDATSRATSGTRPG